MANDILVKVGADITNFSRAMASANRDLQQFSNANQQTFDAFKQTGAIVTGAGIALAGGLGFAVKTAADFESAMSHRSEEHTSELQSRSHLVCSLMLYKKNIR